MNKIYRYLVPLLAGLLVWIFVSAATTISTNIDTDGSITGTTLTDGTFSSTAGLVTGATGNISMWTNDAGYLAAETDPSAILKSIGTTKGDIIAFSDNAAPVRLEVGADGQVLVADSVSAAGIKWTSMGGILPAGIADYTLRYDGGSSTWVNTGNLQTTTAGVTKMGDIVGGNYLQVSASGNITFVGTAGLVTGATGNISMWTNDAGYLAAETDPSAILKSIGTTKGDIIAFSGNAAPVRLEVGEDGQVLVADSVSAAGIKWTSMGGILPAGIADYTLRYDGGSSTWVNTGNLQTTTAGVTKMGDIVGGNYLQVSAAGYITLVGTATIWDDLTVPVTSSTKGGSKDPAWLKVKDNGAGSQGVFTYHFDKTVEQELYFTIQMPHKWKEGTTIYPHVHWLPVDGVGGNVVWGLEYTWADINSTYGSTSIITQTAAAGNIAYKHLMSDIGAGIDGSAQLGASSMLICRVFRQAADEADTYNNKAALMEIDFHYEMDSLGDDIR